MSTFHEEAAMSFGAANPLWVVALIEKLTGDEIHLEVRAADQRQAINKATDRANRDLSSPVDAYMVKGCTPL